MSDLSVGCRVRVTRTIGGWTAGRPPQKDQVGTVVEVKHVASAYIVCVEFSPSLRVWLPSYDLEAIE